jgi:hypothetical protein
MRLLAIVTCIFLGGCSSEVFELPVAYPPEASKVMEGAKKAANEEKIVGPVEVSALREAHALGPGPYVLCIRGNSSATPGTRTYAVFFKDRAYFTTRISVMLDSCETAAFAPLGTGPFLPPEPPKRPPS